MLTPTVSILIPAYNAGLWIATCVESALAQTHPPLDVLVWDDGSTDDTAQVVSRFGQRVKLFRATNAGGNVARNQLLARARGEWVQYLDADDYLEPAKVATQFAEASELDRADVLYGTTWTETWRDGRCIDRARSPLDASADLFTQWLTWELPQTGGALWRRAALQAIGGWKDDQPCCQEHELYFRALQRGLDFQHCPTPHAVYRIWSENTVCRRDPVRVTHERTRLVDEMLQWLAEKEHLRPHHRRAAARLCFEMARTWAKYDRTAAADYYHERRARGLIQPVGPAAPWTYRAVLRMAGFKASEAFAASIRRLRGKSAQSGS